MSRHASMKTAMKISPPYRRMRLLDLCKSNMKAHRALCVDKLRHGSNKEQLAREIISSLPPEEQMLSRPSVSEDPDTCDDLALYVVNEDYEYLLNGIMEELSGESYGIEQEIESEDTLAEESMLCPLCHVRRASFHASSSALVCPCGIQINLPGMSVDSLQVRLAEAFELHAVWSSGTCPTLGDMFHVEFRQSDPSNLEAFCRTCGFLEKVL